MNENLNGRVGVILCPDSMLTGFFCFRRPQCWAVGGAVRDAVDKLLRGGNWEQLSQEGSRPWDLDVVVESPLVEDAMQLAEDLAEALGGRASVMDARRGNVRVAALSDCLPWVDITCLRQPTLEDDLRARDFTVNALAWSFADSCLIDPCGGLDDLLNSRLRSPDARNLADDPLRLMRAWRFSVCNKLHPVPELLRSVSELVPVLGGVADERLTHELALACNGKFPEYAAWVPASGILSFFFSGLDESEKLWRLWAEFDLWLGTERSRQHGYAAFLEGGLLAKNVPERNGIFLMKLLLAVLMLAEKSETEPASEQIRKMLPHVDLSSLEWRLLEKSLRALPRARQVLENLKPGQANLCAWYDLNCFCAQAYPWVLLLLAWMEREKSAGSPESGTRYLPLLEALWEDYRGPALVTRPHLPCNGRELSEKQGLRGAAIQEALHELAHRELRALEADGW